MKRRNLFLVALAVLAAFAVAMMPWTVSTGVVTREAASHIKALTGLSLKVEGRTTIAFLPVPRVKMEDIILTTPGGEPAVRARQLRGELRWLPLLAGRLELSDATLLEPTINATDGGGKSIWTAALERLVQEIESGKTQTRHQVDRLVIVGGSIEQSDEHGHWVGVARKVNGLIAWPAPSRAIEIAASLVWRDTPIEVTVTGPQPMLLLNGEPTDLALKASFAGATLAIVGRVRGARDPQINGELSFTTASLGKTLQSLDNDMAPAQVFGGFTISGSFQASGRSLSLPAATVVLDRDRLEGAVTGRVIEGRPVFSGTFAADSLDLTSFLARIIVRSDDGGWSRETFDVEALSGFDVDLRLSASTASLGRVKLDTVGAGIILKDGRLEVALGGASAYRGSLKGRFSLVPTADGIDTKLQGSFERVDIAPAVADLMGVRRLSGTGHGQFALESTGSSFSDLARNLSGRASFLIKQGEVIGLNVPEALRRVEQRPLSALTDLYGGRTSFEQLSGSLNLANGVATTDAALSASAVKATLGGRIGVGERVFALRGTARSGAGSSVDNGLPFEVLGGWDRPTVSADVQTLIQRSGAAAPLFGSSRPPANALSVEPKP